MTNNNSLDKDPLTNLNNPQQPAQNFGQREGGYLQQNLGPINLVQSNQPIKPITEPIKSPQIIPSITQTLDPLPPLKMTQNPFLNPNTNPIPSNNNIIPVEVPKQDKKQEDKINIVLVLVIFLVVTLVFVLIILAMLNNANNKKNTDNSILNNTVTNVQSGVTPTISSNETNNSNSLTVYDNTRILVNSPLPNQFISKDGVTIVLEGQMKGFFEGTMGYRIVDEFNTKLATGVITADGDNYISFVAFSKQIIISPFTDSPATKGIIEFYETSMQDGSINVLATIPLKFH